MPDEPQKPVAGEVGRTDEPEPTPEQIEWGRRASRAIWLAKARWGSPGAPQRQQPPSAEERRAHILSRWSKTFEKLAE